MASPINDFDAGACRMLRIDPTYCAFTSGLTLAQLIKMPRACNVM